MKFPEFPLSPRQMYIPCLKFTLAVDVRGNRYSFQLLLVVGSGRARIGSWAKIILGPSFKIVFKFAMDPWLFFGFYKYIETFKIMKSPKNFIPTWCRSNLISFPSILTKNTLLDYFLIRNVVFWSHFCQKLYHFGNL